MSNKIGFWSVFALVTGGQIGSGVFILPASLAPFGIYSIIGWILSAIGAISLAFVFGELCSRFPYTGGPHIYAGHAFGKVVAFFTGWTYWVISWVSTGAVVIASVGYLTPIIGSHDNSTYLILEIILLFTITFINLKGLKIAGALEFFLTLLKFIPLIIIPVCALYFFNAENLTIEEGVHDVSLPKILGKVVLLTFWGFIGLEVATTPAGSVENASKNIPRAIIFGTILVAFIYFINSIAIMGLIPGNDLAISKAPYVDGAQIMFQGNWHLLISLITSVVCIGTLNAWVLSSGQIALGLGESGFLPKIFAAKNKSGSPTVALMISSVGILPLLILTANNSLSSQIALIIDFSVIAFLFVYLICALGLLKLIITGPRINYILLAITLIAIIFCGFVIYETAITTLLIASIFTLSGLPIYILWYLSQRNKKKI
jgi:basic amino acid/polyamine antiporter, APA family